MRAQLVIRDRRMFADGCILEVVIWRVPIPVLPTEHGFNERGKGDHRHRAGREGLYVLNLIERLLDDFEADVVAVRGGPI